MQKINRGGPVYYQFDQWSGTSAIRHAVFTRHGGASRAPWASLNLGGTVGDDPACVQHNIQLACDALDLDSAKACTVWQVHRADVVVVRQPVPRRRWQARADGMVTDVPDLPLLMRFADCVPVLFYDPKKQVIGIAHAGWRGTAAQVVVNTVRVMQSAYGSDPADIQAAIGPSIGPDHYQVGPEVVEAVEQSFGSTEGLVSRAEDGSAYLDLWAANRLALERAGVKQIEVAGLCTVEHVADFFSHRGEHGKTGRFGATIALRGA
ncbi:MAG: peptidoglycan editing factor PgeF [Chloroflexota bacterium]